MSILSIDPGINNCGLSVINYEKEFTVIETCLVKNARKFTDSEKVIESKFGNRAVKVIAILNTIDSILTTYKDIDTIVIEAPFYNALTPMAYGSLLEVIFAIKYTIVIKKELGFKLVEPLLVKKLFSNQSQASKEAMKQFLIKKKENKDILLNKDVTELSEHEIDSIAVGYIHYLNDIEEKTNVNVT